MQRAAGRRARTTSTWAAAVALAFLGVGLAACGSSSGDVRTGRPGGTGRTTTTGVGGPTTSDPTDPPRRGTLPADQVVWQVETSGGFVPYVTTLTLEPSVTIYGDGRIIVAAPDTTYRTYHPIALRIGHLSATELAAFVAQVRHSGQFGDHSVDYGTPGITDVGTTIVRFHADGIERSVDVYALGYTERSSLSAPQVTNRQALEDLVDASTKLAAKTEPWVPDRVQVIDLSDRNGDKGSGNVSGEDSTSGPAPWPGRPFTELFPAPTGPTTTVPPDQPVPGPPCVIITGKDAAAIAEADQTMSGNEWNDEGDTRPLAIRPLVPGTNGCTNP